MQATWAKTAPPAGTPSEMIWMAFEEVAVMVYGQASVVMTVTSKSTKTHGMVPDGDAHVGQFESCGEMTRISSPVDAGDEDQVLGDSPVWVS